MSEGQLRRKCVNNEAVPDWARKIPYTVRQDALKDYIKARSIHPEGKFRSRKYMPSQTFAVPHRSIKVDESRRQFYFLPTVFRELRPQWDKEKDASRGKMLLKDYAGMTATKTLPEIEHDCKVTWERGPNAWFLCIPVPVVPKRGQQPPSPRVVALDPGVRAFQTLYDPQRQRVERWGDGDMGREIGDHGHRVDELVGVIAERRKILHAATALLDQFPADADASGTPSGDPATQSSAPRQVEVRVTLSKLERTP